MSVANFHFHTKYSDGQCSPAEAVHIMTTNGYDMLIKTDHDTVEGCEEFNAACDKLNVESFQGIELTAQIDHSILDNNALSYNVHILGLGININSMRDELGIIQSHQNDSLNQLANILIADGYPLRLEVMYNGGTFISERSTLARELVQIGCAADVTEAYCAILNKAPYVDYSATFPTAIETIDIIHRAGGLAILAHPLTLKRGGSIVLERSEGRRMIENIAKHGLDGIESYYLRYDKDTIDYLSHLADDMTLLKSLGSDMHMRRQADTLAERYDEASAYTQRIAPLIDKLRQIKLNKYIR